MVRDLPQNIITGDSTTVYIGTVFAIVMATRDAAPREAASLSWGKAFQIVTACDAKVFSPQRLSSICMLPAALNLVDLVLLFVRWTICWRRLGLPFPQLKGEKHFQHSLTIADTVSPLNDGRPARCRRSETLMWDSLLRPRIDLAASFIATWTAASAGSGFKELYGK